MRGVPGSGKTTIANQLAGADGAIHSTDDYFVQDGEYCFDASKLGEAHLQNFVAFCASLEAGVPIVICDNTNVRRSHFIKYIRAAERMEYMVTIVAMPHPHPYVAASRTVHGVPARTIERMISQWED